jgi:hypothetical protein
MSSNDIINFLKKYYNCNNFDKLNFSENKKYIYYNELLNKEGLRYDKIKFDKKDNIDNYSSHSPSCTLLYNVLTKLNISNNDSIIDIGSGKGFALTIMNLFPFKKILGVEITSNDFNISNKNFEILNITNIQTQNIDINNFNDYSNFNYYYFYNPFSEIIFENIIKNINSNSYVIYKNIHEAEKTILSKYNFKLFFDEKGFERNYYIYKN